jgi:hypothetical protein
MDETLSLWPAWPLRRLAAFIVATKLALAALLSAAFVSNIDGLRPGADDYNIPAWEMRNLPAKWLFAVAEPFRPDLTREQEDEKLLRFFQLSREIDTLESQLSDARQRSAAVDLRVEESVDDKRRERDALENRVEAILEGRLSAVLGELGITRSLGPLGAMVWPPVDLELTRSPYSLAVSPRDRIELVDTRLLREDLSLIELESTEASVERRDNVSALAFPTGGVGAYPTIIDYPASYEAALEVVAHEWLHNYLLFRPLGFNYYSSNSLRTMNETVANIGGRELARHVMQRWPLLDTQQSAPRTERPPTRERLGTQRPDLRAELRTLRGEVDALLAARQIEEAEALMEQRRQELAAAGLHLRKINQAFFAFSNLYAGAGGSPAATNPIGPKLDELRSRSASLAHFLRLVGGFTSVAELDRALGQ